VSDEIEHSKAKIVSGQFGARSSETTRSHRP
jgi:hypothetical protein